MSNFPDFSEFGYQVIQELGQNRAGGRVTYLASNTKTQQLVVIKQFQFATVGANWSDYEAYQREIQILQRLNHSNIPHYINSFETKTGFCLVQDYQDLRKYPFEPPSVGAYSYTPLPYVVSVRKS